MLLFYTFLFHKTVFIFEKNEFVCQKLAIFRKFFKKFNKTFPPFYLILESRPGRFLLTLIWATSHTFQYPESRGKYSGPKFA